MNVDHIAEAIENLAPEQALDTVLAARENARVCLTSSFQAEDMAVLHILRKRISDVPVLFLDTGYHFSQTYEYRDTMAKEWSLQLVNVLPRQTVPDKSRHSGFLTGPTPHAAANCAKSILSSAPWNHSMSGSPVCGANNLLRARISRSSSFTVSPPAKRFGR